MTERPAAVASPADVRAVATGNEELAGRLYSVLGREQGTFAFSPYSLYVALAMTSAGARGETLAELQRGLPLTLPQDRLHRALNAVDQELVRRQGDGVRLDVANSLWGQQGLHVERPFLDTLAGQYGAEMRVVDYRDKPEPARRTINAWVADRTHGKIPELIPAGAISNMTRLALVNAAYFKALWATPFDPHMTAKGPFHAPDGAVEADLMNRTGSFRYARSNGFQAIELPYRDSEMAMDVILPDAGKLPVVERRIATGGFGSLLDGAEPARVALGLPKLNLASGFELRPALHALGIGLLFADNADLSGISTTHALAVSSVVHQATLTVDERGTEAAAATGVILRAASAFSTPPVNMIVDRPFVLAVRDRASGQILFLARVLNPSDR